MVMFRFHARLLLLILATAALLLFLSSCGNAGSAVAANEEGDNSVSVSVPPEDTPSPTSSDASDEGVVPLELPPETDSSSAEPEEPEAEPWRVTAAEDYAVYCTGASVNIRNQPSTEGGIVGSAVTGDELTCTGTVDNGWLRVRYKGTDCYVSGRYFSTEKPVVVTEPPKETNVADSSSFTASPGTGIYYEGSGPLVAIDAGHQAKGDSAKEPIGPGATTTKARVSSGAVGVSTGVPEYQLTLDVSLRLRDALLDKGYAVLMIRETNDVSISNAERAQLANSYNADIFLRIHANSVDASSATGTLTMAPSLDNPYCSAIAKDSQILSQLLVDDLCAETGFRNRGVSITDTMTGINWCQMPVSIIEMGFMSNAKEDEAMQTAAVQQQLVDGMVKAIDKYFSR